MEMITEEALTGEIARRLRERAGLTQTDFWGSVGEFQSNGSRYERGKHTIPRPVRMLIVLRYVIGIEFDVQTTDGLAALSKLTALQMSEKAPKLAAVGKELIDARLSLGRAERLLQD